MKKRERLEIIYDILVLINKNHNQIKPTPLLRKSNLSSSQFDKYILELIEKDFIEICIVDSKKHYSLTKKGFEYINKYRIILKIIEDFDL
ncbi:MAG: winged helix-turn-helix domain-containing protein [Methanosarcina sp.]|jgi:predicted transcriptional regulator|uniref:winged helix-turn-helix domain-containing protein n=1 Tax=Methanosarcina sp. TaxID=2213 RepID=UPI00262C1B79|nr:winged helix-turn-helix domain-containing protein [Methanosarcina sp.]MDD3247089.1 winged helix-turn-helix domain-containing protein [Methanosarcina sp.]